MKGEAFLAGLLDSLFVRMSAPTAHTPGTVQRRDNHKRAVQDLSALAEEAYIYGYPLVLMDVTARVATNVPETGAQHAVLNQFLRVDGLPDANFTSVVLPNVDTLYTSAFLDLSAEPVILRLPDTQGRYYLMPMLDAYTNVFASPGKRTTGTGPLELAIVGPRWRGALPHGIQKVEAPTDLVWLLGRTQLNGKEDMPAVMELTDQYSLTPLSSRGQPYRPPQNTHVDPTLDMKTPPPVLVARMGDRMFFERLAGLLRRYPPPARDTEILQRFEKLGLTPGHFLPSPAAAKAIVGTSGRATQRMRARFPQLGRRRNGWNIDTTLGKYDARYLDRAAIALCALGANLPDDAIYPSALSDSAAEPLDGKHNYVVHFEKGQEPPANAFWSLSMYDRRGYFVSNAIGRYAIGSRDALQRNPDGSLDIYIQREAPSAERTANWLPAPASAFQLLLRVYWPQENMLNGSWAPPPVRKVDA